MKKKLVEVAVYRNPTGKTIAYFTRLDEKDKVSVRCYFPLTHASIRRVGIAANRVGGKIYAAEAWWSAVGFRMVRRW